MRRLLLSGAAALLAVAGVTVGIQVAGGPSQGAARADAATRIVDRSATHPTTTPIKNLVVIFDENNSFDHYFGTYPVATNPSGEPYFKAAAGTPSVNGLTPTLLNNNPNAYNPTRLDRSQAVTCDQNHSYKPEQQAADNGQMDKTVENTGTGDCTATSTGEYYRPGLVMDYYDGNTVTGLWNYAQHFALSDNSYGTTYGPSTVGALNLVSGQTHGATASGSVGGSVANGTVIGDPNPTLDQCSPAGGTVTLSGKNVGDLLNAQGITWGWFQGGFTPASRAAGGTPVCGARHANVAGNSPADYSPHHNPFEYYASTANPKHLAPSSTAMIGQTDQANHQYGTNAFWTAANAGYLPEVSYLKAPSYQDGHAGYSDPLDEQRWLVNTINQLQALPQWTDMAVVIAYDDSDGWYDHQFGPNARFSNDSKNDALTGAGKCGTPGPGAYLDRCGFGPRLPLLVLSPWAKRNYVSHTLTDQTSILRFVEDNWSLGRIGDQSADADAGSLSDLFDFTARGPTTALLLNPTTGRLKP